MSDMTTPQTANSTFYYLAPGLLMPSMAPQEFYAATAASADARKQNGSTASDSNTATQHMQPLATDQSSQDLRPPPGGLPPAPPAQSGQQPSSQNQPPQTPGAGQGPTLAPGVQPSPIPFAFALPQGMQGMQLRLAPFPVTPQGQGNVFFMPTPTSMWADPSQFLGMMMASGQTPQTPQFPPTPQSRPQDQQSAASQPLSQDNAQSEDASTSPLSSSHIRMQSQDTVQQKSKLETSRESQAQAASDNIPCHDSTLVQEAPSQQGLHATAPPSLESRPPPLIHSPPQPFGHQKAAAPTNTNPQAPQITPTQSSQSHLNVELGSQHSSQHSEQPPEQQNQHSSGGPAGQDVKSPFFPFPTMAMTPQTLQAMQQIQQLQSQMQGLQGIQALSSAMQSINGLQSPQGLFNFQAIPTMAETKDEEVDGIKEGDTSHQNSMSRMAMLASAAMHPRAEIQMKHMQAERTSGATGLSTSSSRPQAWSSSSKASHNDPPVSQPPEHSRVTMAVNPLPATAHASRPVQQVIPGAPGTFMSGGIHIDRFKVEPIKISPPPKRIPRRRAASPDSVDEAFQESFAEQVRDYEREMARMKICGIKLVNGRFKCSECQQEFLQDKHVTRHASRHFPYKPFHCVWCKIKFSRSDSLLRHANKCTKNPQKKVNRSISASKPEPAPPGGLGANMISNSTDSVGNNNSSFGPATKLRSSVPPVLQVLPRPGARPGRKVTSSNSGSSDSDGEDSDSDLIPVSKTMLSDSTNLPILNHQPLQQEQQNDQLRYLQLPPLPELPRAVPVPAPVQLPSTLQHVQCAQPIVESIRGSPKPVPAPPSGAVGSSTNLTYTEHREEPALGIVSGDDRQKILAPDCTPNNKAYQGTGSSSPQSSTATSTPPVSAPHMHSATHQLPPASFSLSSSDMEPPASELDTSNSQVSDQKIMPSLSASYVESSSSSMPIITRAVPVPSQPVGVKSEPSASEVTTSPVDVPSTTLPRDFTT